MVDRTDGKALDVDAAQAGDGDVLAVLPRSVTLSLSAPPLTLPGEVSNETFLDPTDASVAYAHLDAWSLDKLRRSSLPPAMAQRAVTTVIPPPARTPAPEAGDGTEDGGALSLIGRSPVPPAPAADLLGEIADRFALGDYTGALRAAELVLGQDPGHDLAQHYAGQSREKLEFMYSSRAFADGNKVVQLALPEQELRWLGLEPQFSTLLARVDGKSDAEAVISASGLPRLEALRGLVALLDGKVIRLV